MPWDKETGSCWSTQMNDSPKTNKQLLKELKRARRELAAAVILKHQQPEVTRYPQEENSTYYKIFLTSPDLSIIIDPADSTYIEVNDAFIEHTGYTREELIGRNVLENNRFADREEFQRMGRIFNE
jgi:PAS domain-containing protein